MSQSRETRVSPVSGVASDTVNRPTTANRRIAAYVVVAFGLLVGYAYLRQSGWRGSSDLHSIMEALATLLALIVGVMALIRYYSRKTNTFLFIGAGFLGTAFLDGYHTVVTSSFFADNFPSSLPSLIPWSWIASRLFLSTMMLLSYLAWLREERAGLDGRVRERTVYGVACVLTVASFLLFALVPLPRAYYPEYLFHRPEEFVPAAFFLAALVGYLRKGHWRVEPFEHWLVMSLIVAVLGQSVFMSFSGQLFDFEFDAAHLLKKLAYVCVLLGLLINMLVLFRKAEERADVSIQELQRASREHERVADDLTRLVETANAPIFGVDERARIVEWNRAASRLTGYDKDEVLNCSLIDEFVADENKTSVKEVFDRALKGQPTENFDLPLTNRHGDRVDILLNATPRLDRDGNIVGVIGVGQDITERLRGERALRESEDRYRGLIENAYDLIQSVDPDGRILFVNQAWLDALGYEWDEIRTRNMFELVHPDSRDHCADIFKTVLSGRPRLNVPATFIRKDGGLIEVEGNIVRRITASGAMATQGIFRDVTERNRHERELREREDQVRLVLESVAEGVCGGDLDGRLTFVNPAAMRLLGQADEKALLGRNAHALMHHTKADGEAYPHEECPIQGAIDSDSRVHRDNEVFWRADGTSFPVEYLAVPIHKDGEIVGTVVSFSDITQRRQAQASLIQASKLATLGEMATGVAHELNQPLNVIRMAAENAAMRIADGELDAPYLNEKLERISAQTERAAAIIDHMRIFGRQADETPQAIDPCSVVEESVGLIGAQLRLREIDVEITLPEECRSVMGHRIQLEQVLLNLIGNARDAIEATREGSGNPGRIRLTVEDSLATGRITIVVSDTGGGVPKGQISRIFEPFYTTKETGKGTGLGLSISYGIVTDMGGTIEVANVDGGAEFVISLPVAESKADAV